MIWILYSIAVVVFTILVIWWIKRPLYHRKVKQDAIKRFIKGLLDQCVDGAVLLIEHENSGRFIQFAKYSSKSSMHVLHFGFPDAPWSHTYIAPLKEALSKASIKFNMTKTNDEPISGFIEVDFTGNSDEISTKGEQVALIALKVMGLAESETFRICYEGGLKHSQG